jgi:hypothetical protein
VLPIAIQSRMISSVFFDPTDGTLRLRMANGQERLFTGVPLSAVTELAQAPSPGRHYVDQFRHRQKRAA